MIESSSAHNTIIGGDFNLVLDVELDQKNSLYNHDQSRKVVVDYMEQAALCDIWRMRNPKCKRFTWYRWVQHQPQASRIDMLLIPQWIADMVQDCNILPGFMTDHSIVTLSIGAEEFQHGPGVWRFNNMLLDDSFCTQMENVLQNILQNSKNLNPHGRWEFLKMEASVFCKGYAKKKARWKRSLVNKLLKQKSELEIKLLDDLNQTDKQTLTKINSQLESYAIEKASEAIFRSKCNYAREREKCTAYFLALEKCRYMEKNMKCVIDDSGKVVHDQKGIL